MAIDPSSRGGWDTFTRSVKIFVGDGIRIRFWHDV
jgi:hypothetical protein